MRRSCWKISNYDQQAKTLPAHLGISQRQLLPYQDRMSCSLHLAFQIHSCLRNPLSSCLQISRLFALLQVERFVYSVANKSVPVAALEQLHSAPSSAPQAGGPRVSNPADVSQKGQRAGSADTEKGTESQIGC